MTSNPLHIMPSSINKRHCGSNSQPWILTAPVGQQINVSLLNFGSRKVETPKHHHLPNCQYYGYVIDKASKRNISICADGQQRSSVVVSLTSVVEVTLNSVQEKESTAEHECFSPLICTRDKYTQSISYSVYYNIS